MKWNGEARCLLFGIRFRLTLAFLICFGAMAAVGLFLLRDSLIPSFVAIEQATTTDDAARVVEAFDAELSHLELLNRDWANWDDMYSFAEKPNAAFLESNLKPASLLNASLSLVMISDRNGQRIGYGSVAPKTGADRDLGLFLQEKSHFLASFTRPPTGRNCGLMDAQDALLMVCWRAILKTDGSGVSAGTLLMGRDLGPDLLRQIRDQTRLPFDLLPAKQAENEEVWWTIAAPKYLPERKIRVTRLEKTIRLDYRLLNLFEEQVATIRIVLPRELMEQGQTVLTRTTLQLGVIALTTGLLLLTAIHLMLVKPLGKLQRELGSIRRQKNWQSRVLASGKDEIGLLSKEVNGLLGVINEQVDDLQILSLTDPLTGLANRRAFDLQLTVELQRVKRTGSALSILMLDIDFFKQYNDCYGHPAGDCAIKGVAQSMVSVARRGQDLDARIGGEEFVVLLPDTDEEGARRVAQAVQAELARRAIPHGESRVAACITVSIGLAISTDGSESPEQLIVRADHALYNAKKNGRNRIESA